MVWSSKDRKIIEYLLKKQGIDEIDQRLFKENKKNIWKMMKIEEEIDIRERGDEILKRYREQNPKISLKIDGISNSEPEVDFEVAEP